ncbi:hypothetical protein [Natrinema sp. SYSU A 869]|uniref:hypothetical protein n=1 Tax=Natrinema sp. SYSU A 869 TaxID=2871694 RepID=UPI001CA46BD1|nr:hypothetical protein [Natrinema sp. SYSU A 869]
MENRPVTTGQSEFATARLPPADGETIAEPPASSNDVGAVGAAECSAERATVAVGCGTHAATPLLLEDKSDDAVQS